MTSDYSCVTTTFATVSPLLLQSPGSVCTRLASSCASGMMLSPTVELRSTTCIVSPDNKAIGSWTTPLPQCVDAPLCPDIDESLVPAGGDASLCGTTGIRGGQQCIMNPKAGWVQQQIGKFPQCTVSADGLTADWSAAASPPATFRFTGTPCRSPLTDALRMLPAWDCRTLTPDQSSIVCPPIPCLTGKVSTRLAECSADGSWIVEPQCRQVEENEDGTLSYVVAAAQEVLMQMHAHARNLNMYSAHSWMMVLLAFLLPITFLSLVAYVYSKVRARMHMSDGVTAIEYERIA